MTKLRLAIVGAGPAGIYAADILLKAERKFDVSIDLFDQLPAPYGLVRYGVAPDHPRIKGIITALRDVPSAAQWTFPPPPRLGHVKEIVFHGDELYVGIEIGALLRSRDGGETFIDLKVDPDVGECDVHRILLDARKPGRILIANGLMGLMRSDDIGAKMREMFH